jgi:UDP-N-acetylmuramoyl-tripeptide--D-alanyl-D-alanine ligase
MPDFGMITNLGKAHLEGFGGFEGVIRAKSELYQNLMPRNKIIFANAEDPLLINLLGNYKYVEKYGEINSDCFVSSVKFYDGQLLANIFINNKEFTLKPKLFGRYNILNILSAIKIGVFFNVDSDKTVHAIQTYTPENNRSQIHKTAENTLILDSYNANPSSMKSALESFAEIKSDNKIAILGEMKELGVSSIEEHNTVIEMAKVSGCIQNIFVGEGFLPFLNDLEFYFKNTDELIEYLIQENISGKLIFIKGSRANQLETIVQYL